MHILIVEDNELLRKAMEECLASFHADRISHAQTLDEAKAIVNADPAPDVCLIDLKLVASGRITTIQEVLEAIPEMQKRTPIAIVTGSPDDAHMATVPVLAKDENLWKLLPRTVAKLLLSGKWANADKSFARIEELERKLSDGTAT